MVIQERGEAKEVPQNGEVQAEVTPNGGLVREYPPNPLNSGLGIIVICPDIYMLWGTSGIT